MRDNDIRYIFSKNYLLCEKAINSTNSEHLKNMLHGRLSQTVLIYSEVFELSIFEAEKELKFFVKQDNDGGKE